MDRERRTAGADDCDNINIPADDLPEEHKQVVKSGRQKAALQAGGGGAASKGKKKPRDDRDIYGMHNCDPHKYFKSGYGGYVPFTADLVGMNSTAESHVGANRLRLHCTFVLWFPCRSFVFLRDTLFFFSDVLHHCRSF